MTWGYRLFVFPVNCDIWVTSILLRRETLKKLYKTFNQSKNTSVLKLPTVNIQILQLFFGIYFTYITL